MGSTGSHHPRPVEPLSDLIRRSGSSARRVPSSGSDILQMLGAPGASPIVGPGSGVKNSDDAPTVITRNHPPSPPSGPIPGTGSEAQSLAGRRLGHFELIESIGAGGMAAVLKARDLDLDRIVALKILPPEAARDPESVTRFKQEARAAAMLDHENIARAYFCGEDQGLHFIAFEFVEGENLRQMIDHRGTLPPAECVRYMIQIAAGLNHAAERNVVHRDIKPSNIIITPEGRAKIVDMGLARQMDGVNGVVTQSGVTLGTFDYISPEQALDPRRADVRSDIYSLGCAFYHALTGRPPVPEGTAAKKLHAHQHIDPLDPRAINPAIPDDLAAILSRMMAKNPDERYQSPAELISHLKGLAERLKITLEMVATDSAVQAVRASQAVPAEPPRLRLGWVIAAAAVVVAIAVIALSTGDPDSHTRPPPWVSDPQPRPTEPIVGPLAGPQARPEQAADGVVLVHTVAELATALADPKTIRVHLDAGTYDLTSLPEGIVFPGKELELVGSTTGVSRIVVAASHSLAAMSRPQPGTLTIKAATFTARSLGFEIHVEPFAAELVELQAFPIYPIGLAIHSASEVNLIDCSFLNLVPQEQESATVAVTAAAESAPVRVRLARCAFGSSKEFARGGVALQAPARVIIDVDDSGFGPHAAAIQILAAKENGAEPPPVTAMAATVRLARSSFMLDSNCAAVAASAPVTVTAGYCLFAAVGTAQPISLANPLGVVLQVSGTTESARYVGSTAQKNAYYRVNPGSDKNATTLTGSPWADPKPLETLSGSDPWRAFALHLTDPAVFLPKDPVVKVIGAQFHNAMNLQPRRAYPELRWPPLEPASTPSTERMLVWHPEAKEDPLPRDTYSDLGALLKAARSGDTVLVRHNGLLSIETTAELKLRGNAAEFRLVIKPFPGSKPILTAPGGPALDQTLFRILSGEFTFEGIQFFLKPSRPRNPQVVSAVAIVGGKGCTFRDCVFTAVEEDEGKVAAVVLADPDKVMAMDGMNRPTPEVKFERCVLRGKGRGVWVPVSRAVKVEVNHSLAAQDGPFFLEEPAGKASGLRSTLKLNRTTFLVAGPVVEIRAGKSGEMMRTGGLVPLDVEADECLFAAVPNAGQPLVELDGIEPADVKTVITWQVRKANRYANFDPSAAVALVKPGTDGSTPKEWDWNQWITFAGEPPAAGAGKPVGKVTFEKGPASARELRTLRPADAEVVSVTFTELIDPRPSDAGVDTKSLPVVWEETRPD